MSLTVTLHAWWLVAYLAVGCATFLPLNYLAWRQIGAPRDPFWVDLGRHVTWRHVVVQVALWPAAIWELVR